jgi:hypothetical protein
VIIRDQKRVERSTAGLDNIRAKLMLVLLCLLWGINWPVRRLRRIAVRVSTNGNSAPQ